MVGRDDLPNAVGLNSASFNAARIVGPAVAGLLITWIGTGPVFLVNAVSFVAVVAALRLMRASELHPSPPLQRGKGQLREGFRYVGNRPDLVFVLVVVGFVGTFGLNFQMTMALMATEVYDKGAAEYGVLGSIMAVGSLTGALFAARRGRPRLRLVTGAGVVFGLCTVASGLMPTYELFALSLIPVGMSALTLITAANSTMQLSVDPAVRGRVMALYTAVFFGGTPLGAPLVGQIAESFGARWSLIGGGAISALATVVAALLLIRRQHLVVHPHLLPRPSVDVHTQQQEDLATQTSQQA
jgi:MFS family permease